MPPFNFYVDEEKLLNDVSKELKLVRIVNFASTYYIGSRVVKPILLSLVGAKSSIPKPDHWMNKLFAKLPPFGAFGTQKLMILEKR